MILRYRAPSSMIPLSRVKIPMTRYGIRLMTASRTAERINAKRMADDASFFMGPV